MSNSTSTTPDPSATSSAPPSPSTSSPPLSTPSSSIANTTPSAPSSSSSFVPPSSSFSSTPSSTPPSSTPVSSSSSIFSSSTIPPSSSSTSSTPPPSTSTPADFSSSAPVSFVTVTPSASDGSTQSPIVVIETRTASPTVPTGASETTSSAAQSSTDASLINGGGSSSGSGGLSGGGKTAVEVIVPIAGVALIALAVLFLWRRRKQRKDAEELRRKEVEEYGYNPNDDPTLPPVGGVAAGSTSDGPFEMREEGTGYRGWGATSGTTAAGSTARKASTTMSGGGVGMAYSEGTSPSQGPQSETRSNDPLVRGADGRPLSGGEEALGAMGPAAAANRNGDVHRGPSNASSSYSAANRSDGSGEGAVPGGAYGQAQYYAGENNFAGPYASDGYPAGRAEMAGQPVIRDNLARRATRIENPSHFPTQASAGISQNF